ncbi:MAG TPA: Sec-independent protein translocase subunit TatA [Streptosporangiaceae bacterium]
MFSDLFDSPWKVLIIAAVVLVLFGAKKMPDAARSLGKSMRILKTEVQGLHDDDEARATTAQTVQAPPAQIDAPGTPASAPAAEPQHQKQPS